MTENKAIKKALKGVSHQEIFERVGREYPELISAVGTIRNFFSKNGVPGMTDETAKKIEECAIKIACERAAELMAAAA